MSEDEDKYHEARALVVDLYSEAVRIFPFILDLKERKTFNPTYPVSILKSIIEVKCGLEPTNGVLIAVMLVRGFKCDWKSDPCFNISSASKSLK